MQQPWLKGDRFETWLECNKLGYKGTDFDKKYPLPGKKGGQILNLSPRDKSKFYG
jgi:hypothetical protein